MTPTLSEIKARHKADDIEVGTWRIFQAGAECHKDRDALIIMLKAALKNQRCEHTSVWWCGHVPEKCSYRNCALKSTEK